MNVLKRFRLPSFSIAVSECTPTERAGVEMSRDCLSVRINAKAGAIVIVVGSPIIGDWQEVDAVRAAISFASTPSCHDDAADREWSESNGELLSNEAFCHRLLGKELRE